MMYQSFLEFVVFLYKRAVALEQVAGRCKVVIPFSLVNLGVLVRTGTVITTMI